MIQAVVFLLVAFAALALIWWILKLAFALLVPLLVAMLAGMFAGRIVRGRGYGPIGDILLGFLGGIVGTLVLGLLGINLGGIIGYIIASIIGAVILVYVIRLFANSKFAS